MNKVHGDFVVAGGFNYCYVGVLYGPVPFGRTEDCGTEDNHS